MVGIRAMFINRLKHTRRCLGGNYLLLAAVVACGWTGVGIASPPPQPAIAAQGQGKAAKAAARKAANPSRSERRAAKHAATSPPTGEPVESGQRDPFYIPPPPKPGAFPGVEGEPAELPPGKRGLVVAQLTLEGIVRQEASNIMIAVVANPANRAYFLREKDEVYSGVVSKITPDSVQFTETYRDVNGQMSTREIVKRLGSGPGENK